MKVLKIIGMLLLAVMLVFLALGLMGAKTFQAERSIVIDASKSAVFPHVQYLKKRDAWSPWRKKDPNMEQEYGGTDGAIGASHSWNGDPKSVGKGHETITLIKPNELVETNLVFESPQASTSTAFINLSDADKGTKVTWGFKGETSFMEKIVFTFMDLDAAVGPDFEDGLKSLKAVVENEKSNKKKFAIQEIDHPDKNFIGNRQLVKMDKIQAFYQEHLGKIFGACQAKKIEMDGQPCGLYYKWDEENGEADMAAAIPVKKAADLGDGMKAISIPGGKALLIDYYGSYEGSTDAHYAMDDYMKSKGYKFIPPVIEEYVTDPTTEPNSDKWLTKIVYFVE